ncbi:DEAD/DEAH box helicase family protein [Streptomyces sp. NPDC057838]|uniref:helicase associated domain-containing protein n=1 Tax=unclassified Streptomyces TaxID=2593676 RepID=UPI0036D03852
MTKLRPHQREAVDAVLAALQVPAAGTVPERGLRTQVVMATGSGKTLVAARSARELQAGRVLVLVPSLGLLAQTEAAWREGGRTGPVVGVSSLRGEDVTFPNTTDVEELVAWVRPFDTVTVIATYASLGLGTLERAQFYEREGHLRVPRKHVETIAVGGDGNGGNGENRELQEVREVQEVRELRLGAWIRNQRSRAAALSQERVELLSAIGMRWSRRVVVVTTVVVALAAGCLLGRPRLRRRLNNRASIRSARPEHRSGAAPGVRPSSPWPTPSPRRAAHQLAHRARPGQRGTSADKRKVTDFTPS